MDTRVGEADYMARNKYRFAEFMLVATAVLIVAGVLIRERNR